MIIGRLTRLVTSELLHTYHRTSSAKSASTASQSPSLPPSPSHRTRTGAEDPQAPVAAAGIKRSSSRKCIREEGVCRQDVDNSRSISNLSPPSRSYPSAVVHLDSCLFPILWYFFFHLLSFRLSFVRSPSGVPISRCATRLSHYLLHVPCVALASRTQTSETGPYGQSTGWPQSGALDCYGIPTVFRRHE